MNKLQFKDFTYNTVYTIVTTCLFESEIFRNASLIRFSYEPH